MGMPEKSSPFDLLVKIDELYDNSASLPDHQKAQGNKWLGIGFRLGQHRFVIDIKDLEEILTESVYTKVPIVKPWLKGVANMRGHLLAVIDLCKLFNIATESSYKQRRVMAVKKDQESGYVGFFVDAVFGMQHFSTDNALDLLPTIPDELRPFVSGVYENEQCKWFVFNTRAFINSMLFLNVDVRS